MTEDLEKQIRNLQSTPAESLTPPPHAKMDWEKIAAQAVSFSSVNVHTSHLGDNRQAGLMIDTSSCGGSANTITSHVTLAFDFLLVFVIIVCISITISFYPFLLPLLFSLHPWKH